MKKLYQSDTNPLRSKWPLIFTLLALASLVGYFVLTDGSGATAKTDLGLFYGIAGFSAILLLAFLRVRKAMYGVKIGSLSAWVQAHVYIGILSMLLILLHTGLRFSGAFSTLLFVLFALVVGSGIVGMLIYTITPSSLAKFGRELLFKDEVLSRLDHHLEEADKTAKDSSEELDKLYKKKIRHLFESKSTRWGYLFKEERQILKKAQALFDNMKSDVPDESTYDLSTIGSIYMEAQRLRFKWAKTRALRVWLNIHVPLTVMMLGAALFHIFTVIYY